MAKRMTNKQVEMFAKIHVATHASYFDFFGVDEIEATDEDKERLIEAVHNLAKKIAKGQPMNFGENKQIVEYVRRQF